MEPDEEAKGAGQPNPIPLNERRYMPSSFLSSSFAFLVSIFSLSAAPIEQDLWMFPMGPYFIDFAPKICRFPILHHGA